MEVTRDNFLEVLPEIECAIKDADFIAIDGEFSGIGTDLPSKVVYDTPAQRYARLRKGLANYIIIQYGICTFKWSKDLCRYEAKPFNIYIFPRAANRNDAKCKFLCQSSSIEFLANQGFDFNKLFYKGISYVTADKEATMRMNMNNFLSSISNGSKTPKSMRANNDDSHANTPMYIPDIMKKFVDDICDKVTKLVENDEETVLDLPTASSFRRKLIYNVIEERYSGLHLETATSEKGEKYIKIIKASEDQRKKLREECEAKKMAEFETAVGFLKVAKLLSESKKLIIGHNMLLDMMLTIGQFFTPLPETLEEFKDLIQTVFPKLVDTKLLSTTQPLKDKVGNSRLGDLYSCLCGNFKVPDITLCEGFEAYAEGTDKFHEAGYDAFCTGVCFAKMANHLCLMQYPGDVFKAIDLDAAILSPFINRIYVMRINDLTYIKMDAPDDIPDRRNVFHVTFPSTWRYGEINHLFNNFAPVQVSFLGETSALVTVSREDLIDDVIKDFVSNKTHCSPYNVTTYSSYAESQNMEKKDQSLCEVRGNENRKRKKLEDQEVSTPLKAPKKKREKRKHESLEEGELSDSSQSSSAEEVTAEETPQEKPSIHSKKQKNSNKPPAKDFFEPDDW